MKHQILIANNLINVPATELFAQENDALVGTIVSNMASYGYMPSIDVMRALQHLGVSALEAFWAEVEPAMAQLSGSNRNMADFVVYKNFPQEVLDMDASHYWINQILMYWGFDSKYFSQEVQERNALLENNKLKVLSLADENSLPNIYQSLVNSPARWSDQQKEHALYLVENLQVKNINVDNISFKENGIVLLHAVMGKDVNIVINNATDVLRLAALMSEGDVSLRKKVKFKKFNRIQRKYLLSLLDSSKNLVADIAMRPEEFKRLLSLLHPGDYKFEKVKSAYNDLYRGHYTTGNALFEKAIAQKDISVLDTLKKRPGEFVRKLHQMYALFGDAAITAFKEVIPQLKTIQLLKLDKYAMTVNNRSKLIYAPNGNWTKAQFVANEKTPLSAQSIANLHEAISFELQARMNAAFPLGIDLDGATVNIKLPTNDAELASYGRGTVFDIPADITFIRSASYWSNVSYGNTWFDNSWNFFNENWQGEGACCWNATDFAHNAAIFSGDPTNSQEMEGRACQMIDLYIDKMLAAGVRYAVWNVLSYNGIPFGDTKELLMTLQYGENAQDGQLYEPSRAQMVFPVVGANLTKYIAYIDLQERKLVYMDANMYGNIQSAQHNTAALSEKMPAFIEYLQSLPSVAELFVHAKTGSTPVLYSDADKAIDADSSAYVFKPENGANKFKQIDLLGLLK